VGRSSFNVCGPANQRMCDAPPVMRELFGWRLTTSCTRDRMGPRRITTTIHEARSAAISRPRPSCPQLGAGYAIPTMVTPISALGSAVQLFAENPDQ
jgi:hypothetical protein